MVFGEIVEPSTRALIEDELYEQSKSLEWDQEVQPEETIGTLLVSETTFANKILQVCLLDNVKPICGTLGSEISIYKKGNDCVILCNSREGVSIGEILENIIPWIKNSNNVYALTTAPIATFINKTDSNISEVTMRELSTGKLNFYPRLEMPNLISGVTAGVQTYCIHTNRNCTLFVNYTECEPLDSVNSKPVIDLLRKINLTPTKEYRLVERVPANNLYM